jgi:hypothetical protein
MKKKTFILTVKLLRYCVTLGLAFCIFLLIWVMGQILWDRKLSAGLMELDPIVRPIITVPITLHFRDHTDTTITFRNKQHPEMGNDLYHSREGFDYAGRIGYPNVYEKHNKEILTKYKKGIYEVTDTTLSYVYADYEPKGSKEVMPFRFSKPQFVKGQILAEPTDKGKYWWIRWVNAFTIFLKYALFIFLTWLLRKLLLKFERFEFFSMTNFRAIQKMGVVLVLMGVVDWLSDFPHKLVFNWLNPTAQFNLVHSDLVYLERLFYIEKMNNRSYHFTIIPLDSPFFIGIIIIILSEIFRYGLKLQKEQDLTI